MEAKKKVAFRQGWIVLFGLAILTIIEYYASFLATSATVILFIIGLIKAWAIIKYFMHISTLWTEEGGH